MEKIQTVMDRVKAGEFKDCYLAYARKSTNEANSQQNSISYQSAEIHRLMEREGLKLAPITIESFCEDGLIAERHSGFKESDDFVVKDNGRMEYRTLRPKFSQMVVMLNKKYFKGVIAFSSERLSRNPTDDLALERLRGRVSILYVMAKYEDTAAGTTHRGIDQLFNRHHSLVTSEKVRTNIHNLAAQGVCYYMAPNGYKNEGNMSWKPIDEEKAPLIRRCFELAASGHYSLLDLVRYSKEVGLKMNPQRPKRSYAQRNAHEEVVLDKVERYYSVNTMSRMLQNRFYLGEIRTPDGTWLPSVSHEPLIDRETFNKVQEILRERTVSKRHPKKLPLPYRGFCTCDICGRSYRPYTKKGHVYFRNGCRDDCPNKGMNLRVSDVEGGVQAALEQFNYTPEEIQNIIKAADRDTQILLRKVEDGEMENAAKRTRLEKSRKYLVDNKTELLETKAYSPAEYTKEMDRIAMELEKLSTTVDAKAFAETSKSIVEIVELLKALIPIHENAKYPVKEEIARAACVELRVRMENGKTAFDAVIKEDLSLFLNLESTSCAPDVSFVELFSRLDTVNLIHSSLNRLVNA